MTFAYSHDIEHFLTFDEDIVDSYVNIFAHALMA